MSVGLVATIKESRRTVHDGSIARTAPALGVSSWNVEKFASDQIHGLVSRIFSQANRPPVRQIVFSAIGSNIDVDEVCQRVARVLAAERPAEIALVTTAGWSCDFRRGIPLKRISTQIGRNFWCVPGPSTTGLGESFTSLDLYLAALRAEFEYSIVASPPAGESDVAIATARCADGIVLVLSTQTSRRAAALRVKGTLCETGVRLLGAVLVDREFSIPERLYRRL